jgi:predicted MFS family arabinose efflux permease
LSAPTTIRLSSVFGLAALMLSTFVAITTELLPVGLLPQMSREFDVPESTMGLVVTVYALAVTVLALPLTTLTARLPRKRLLLATLVGYAVSNLLVALAPTFIVVCIGRGIGGIAHALFFSVVSAYATKLVPKHLVGRAIAITYAGTSLGFVLGVPLATSVGSAVGWRLAFGALVGISVLLVLITAVLLPSVTGESESHSARFRAWRRSGLLAVGIANAVLFFGHYVAYTYIASLIALAGVEENAVGSVLLLLGGAGIIGLIGAGLLVDRLPRLGLLVTIAIMALGLITLTFVSDSLVGTLVAVGAWCLAFGAAPSFLITAAIRTGAVSADIAGAVVNGTSNLGIAAGAAVGAQIFAAAGPIALPPVGAVLFVITVIVVVFARQAFPSKPHRENLGTGAITLPHLG